MLPEPVPCSRCGDEAPLRDATTWRSLACEPRAADVIERLAQALAAERSRRRRHGPILKAGAPSGLGRGSERTTD
jgi:hypothetical protein